MYYVGIDGGGTKCHAVIENTDGLIIGQGRGGPANPVHGFQLTIDSMMNAVSEAASQAGLRDADFSQFIVAAGLAGINFKSNRQKLESWKHPFKSLYFTTDLNIANLGAHKGANGAVIIVGTGSCGFVEVNDNQLILGGHGFPIGDVASGAWMGLKAIEYTLTALDGFKATTLLSEAVCEHFSITSANALSQYILDKKSKDYAELAPLIFKAAEQGDVYSQSIIDQAVNYISWMINELCNYNPSRITILGGLSDMIVSRLEPLLAEKIFEPLLSPEEGALLFAHQQSNIDNKIL